jgi:two-component system cell cycle response regulator DivK
VKRAAKDNKPAGRKRKVLVVDDFEDNRAMYAEFLSFSGFEVVEAANGVEAIQKAFALMPDVVVMDLSLPVLDGWEATRQLKADPRTRDIPVIALTGHALEGHSQGAREAGCDWFLAKPCLPETLLETLNEVLSVGPRSALRASRDKVAYGTGDEKSKRAGGGK